MERFRRWAFMGAIAGLISGGMGFAFTDSGENDDEIMKYLIESYNRLFVSRGGLSDFVIYDENYEVRNQLNETYNEEVKKVYESVNM